MKDQEGFIKAASKLLPEFTPADGKQLVDWSQSWEATAGRSGFQPWSLLEEQLLQAGMGAAAEGDTARIPAAGRGEWMGQRGWGECGERQVASPWASLSSFSSSETLGSIYFALKLQLEEEEAIPLSTDKVEIVFHFLITQKE